MGTVILILIVAQVALLVAQALVLKRVLTAAKDMGLLAVEMRERSVSAVARLAEKVDGLKAGRALLRERLAERARASGAGQ